MAFRLRQRQLNASSLERTLDHFSSIALLPDKRFEGRHKEDAFDSTRRCANVFKVHFSGWWNFLIERLLAIRRVIRISDNISFRKLVVVNRGDTDSERDGNADSWSHAYRDTDSRRKFNSSAGDAQAATATGEQCTDEQRLREWAEIAGH